jgi:hypothetical protein
MGRQGEGACVVFYLALLVSCAMNGFAVERRAYLVLCPHREPERGTSEGDAQGIAAKIPRGMRTRRYLDPGDRGSEPAMTTVA